MKYAIPMLAAMIGVLTIATPAPADEPPVVETVYVETTYQGKNVNWWARRAVQARKDANKRGRTIKRLKKVLAYDATVVEAINLATVTYGVSGATMWRKARCESRLRPYAKNRSSTAAGLFQFLDSTWASTPFGRFSVYSPYANAMAAGWMHAHGRSGEWVCK